MNTLKEEGVPEDTNVPSLILKGCYKCMGQSLFWGKWSKYDSSQINWDVAVLF